MRALVTLLVLLTGLKIWTQEQMYRSATADAIIQAYRSRAVDACQKGNPADAQRLKRDFAAQASKDPESVKLTIGRSNVDVYPWDLNNPLWDARYKHPNLVLSAGNRDSVVCAYDVVAGIATVSGL